MNALSDPCQPASECPVTAARQFETVGVCILSWNTRASLVRCVAELIHHAGLAPRQLVVVDNASRDGSLQALRERFPEVPVLANPKNLGYSRGNNQGAAHLMARGFRWLLFVNPDVLLEHTAVAAMLNVLTADPSVGCVGGVPIRPGRCSPGRAGRNRPTLVAKLILYGPLAQVCGRWVEAGHIVRSGEIRDGECVYAIYGAACMFPAAAFAAIGGFDEEFFLYEEEFVIAERLRARGLRVALTRATYLHDEAAGTRQIPFRRRIWFLRSEFRFLRKYWRWPLAACAAVATWRILELAAFSWYYGFRAAQAGIRRWAPLRRRDGEACNAADAGPGRS
jgi:GT2 family glycosyltransferase